MEERKVTVGGETRKIPEPFLVIATQNPSGTVGTQRLPEARTEQFMIGYPVYMKDTRGAERNIEGR